MKYIIDSNMGFELGHIEHIGQGLWRWVVGPWKGSRACRSPQAAFEQCRESMGNYLQMRVVHE
jgi:hypothetical protein